MNTRSEWLINANSESSEFYTAEETLNNVIENFNIRRNYSNEGKEITINGVTDKCLVQTSSNPLKELDDQRKIHCPLSMVINRGDYVTYEGNIWLITTNVVNIDGAYQSTRMSMCNWELKWQNSLGNIISRWAYVSSVSKSNDGETGNSVITLGSDQLFIEIPVDEESLHIKRNTKFFIDNNNLNPIVYELTGIGNVVNTYKGHGVTNWIVKETRYSPTADDLKYGVCDYITPTTPPTPPDETIVLLAHISYSGSPVIRIGGYGKTFNATLTDATGVETTMTAIWTVEPNDYVTYTQNGNSLFITCDNEDLDGRIITLSVRDEHSGYSTSVEITLSVF